MRSTVISLLLSTCVLTGSVYSSQTASSLTDQELLLLESFGPWPIAVPQDPGNELSGLKWAEELGARLFVDPALSGSGQIACSTCHQPDNGFSDGLSVAAGQDANVRNTQGLLNVGLQRWFGWDGGTDSLWGASLRPILSGIEMNAEIGALAALYRDEKTVRDALAAHVDLSELDDEEVVVLLAKAIGAYTRTLFSQETEFDRFRAALIAEDLNTDLNTVESYSESAVRGLKIFLGDANCHLCHFGPNFSNGEFHDIGRPFFTAVGQVDPGRHSGIKRVRSDRYNLAGRFNGDIDSLEVLKTETVILQQSNFGQWRTPSLRNLTLTAPYMHDGSLATLRDVVDFYAEIDPTRLHSKGESLLKPLDLDEQAREDLVQFLETLSPAQAE